MLRNSTPYRTRHKKRDGKERSIIAATFGGGALLVLLSAYLVYRWLAGSSFLLITDVDLVGGDKLDKKEIIQLSGLGLHANLLTISAGTMEQRIEAHSWVEKAAIEKKWPNRLIITVTERKPVAIANVEGDLHYIDGKGVIFAEMDYDSDLDFPIISGLSRKDLEASDPSPSLNCALQFLRYVGRNDPVLPGQNISEVNIRQKGDLVVFLADKPFPIYLGSDNMERKYLRLVKVLGWLYKKKEIEITEFIRLDYLPDKVMVGKTG